MNAKLRILIAEDHRTVREGIKLLVNAQNDMQVVGEANDGEMVLELAASLQPDIVLMDISMPVLNGLRATEHLHERHPDVKILVLTRHTDDAYLRQVIAAGANGYVLKQSAPSELINAIRTVSSGNSYLDASLTQKVMGGYAGGPDAVRGENKADLTSRESEVLRLIALGYSNKEIAARIGLSVKTIETHKANAMRKLGMTTRIDIVRYAILQNWLDDE